MDFDFSPDQELLRESVRRYLVERAPIATYVRGAYDSPAGGGADDAVWRGLAELGVVGLLVPEEHGGAGGGMVDVAVVCEELGRAVNPLPFGPSAVGTVSLVRLAGSAREHAFLLPGLADGSVVGAVGVFEPGARYRWTEPTTVARSDGDRWSIDGTKAYVADAASASLLLV